MQMRKTCQSFTSINQRRPANLAVRDLMKPNESSAAKQQVHEERCIGRELICQSTEGLGFKIQFNPRC